MSSTILSGRTLRAYTDGLGRLSAALDTDAPTMEEHLSIHPEDALCPICEADPDVMPRCPRCLGDGRRGEDCPNCGGRHACILGGDVFMCVSPGCRCGRLVEATDGE